MSEALNEPLSYVFPTESSDGAVAGQLSLRENDPLRHARKLSKDDLRRLAAQVRAVADLK